HSHPYELLNQRVHLMGVCSHIKFRKQWLSAGLLLLACLVSSPANADPPRQTATNGGEAVSYYRQVRPILQANCQGCHQPAKAKGGFVMTDFKKFLAGGDDEGAAIVPGHPEKSSVINMVTPKDGEARMPKGKAAL